MNKIRVEKIMLAAQEILATDEMQKKLFVQVDGQSKLESRYNGYVASFGPMIRNNKLLPTLAFYSRKDGQDERQRVLELIHQSLCKAQIQGFENDLGQDLYKSVGRMIQNEPTQRGHYTQLFQEAAVACKLAMRTFPIHKSDEG